ncbi:MAG: hypothetical protein M3040_00825, partial [Bacteroidota bacterium]|nr:hypothetical protein [Bacteroidota bacterium]
YAGRWFRAIGRSIIFGYNGEFWKGYIGDYGSGQTNMMNHYYDNGLMVGQYGAIKGEPHMAGSAFGAEVTQVGNDIYQYNNDESFYGGIHRWSITNTNTIEVNSYPLGTNVLPGEQGIDLLAGLPPVGSFAKLVTNTAGWTRSPVSDNADITTTIGARSYDKFKSPDLFIESHPSQNGNITVTRDLGNNIALSSWALKGIINISALHGNYDVNGAFVDVLDNADKVIARFNLEQLSNSYPKFNDKILVSVLPDDLTWKVNNQFEIIANGGTLTCTFGKYTVSTTNLVDASANWQNPKNLRFSFYHNLGYSLEYKIDIVAMKFINNPSSNTIPTPAVPIVATDAIKRINSLWFK